MLSNDSPQPREDANVAKGNGSKTQADDDAGDDDDDSGDDDDDGFAIGLDDDAAAGAAGDAPEPGAQKKKK